MKRKNHQLVNSNKSEKAVLVAVIRQKETLDEVKENLDELAFLALTAGAKVKESFVQRLAVPNGKSYVGSGKLLEIKEFVEQNKIDAVIVDDELSPSQIKNLEKSLEAKIIDRTSLILDIFAGRAKTFESKTQVELAQCEYMLPRLTKLWTHLSRQKGGIGLRGPGETEIETDRRIIRNKIALLKKQLKQIEKQNDIQRKNRKQKVRVALVGYTNAGKSTIMNIISKANVFAEDKLFATLDTTVRNVVIDNITFLLSDTVGFIRKLPHRLVESFKSTLNETREADILLHVVDISHPNYEQQIRTVNQTLEEIGVADKPVLMVYNKIDNVDDQFIGSVSQVKKDTESVIDLLKKSYIRNENGNAIFISAKHKINIAEFRSRLLEQVKITYKKVYPHYPLTVAD